MLPNVTITSCLRLPPPHTSHSIALQASSTILYCSPISCCLVIKSCPTVWDPLDCSTPSSSVHGIFQSRILEWVAISYTRGFSWPRDQTHVSWILLLLSHQGSPLFPSPVPFFILSFAGKTLPTILPWPHSYRSSKSQLRSHLLRKHSMVGQQPVKHSQPSKTVTDTWLVIAHRP